jgi:hypothetical protein
MDRFQMMDFLSEKKESLHYLHYCKGLALQKLQFWIHLNLLKTNIWLISVDVLQNPR